MEWISYQNDIICLSLVVWVKSRVCDNHKSVGSTSRGAYVSLDCQNYDRQSIAVCVKIMDFLEGGSFSAKMAGMIGEIDQRDRFFYCWK